MILQRNVQVKRISSIAETNSNESLVSSFAHDTNDEISARVRDRLNSRTRVLFNGALGEPGTRVAIFQFEEKFVCFGYEPDPSCPLGLLQVPICRSVVAITHSWRYLIYENFVLHQQNTFIVSIHSEKKLHFAMSHYLTTVIHITRH